MADKEFDTEFTDLIVCPYCGHEDRDSWDVDFGPGIEGDASVQCGMCDKEFFVEKVAKISYISKKMEG